MIEQTIEQTIDSTAEDRSRSRMTTDLQDVRGRGDSSTTEPTRAGESAGGPHGIEPGRDSRSIGRPTNRATTGRAAHEKRAVREGRAMENFVSQAECWREEIAALTTPDPGRRKYLSGRHHLAGEGSAHCPPSDRVGDPSV